MRPQMEIRKAHAILAAALALQEEGLVPNFLPEELRKPVMMAADCLAWISHSGCEHAKSFEDFLFWIEHDLSELGIAIDSMAQIIPVE